jgi:hypothetical protein
VVFAIDMPVRFLAAGRPAVYFGAGAGRTSLGRRWWMHLGLWVAEFQKNASHVASDVKKESNFQDTSNFLPGVVLARLKSPSSG